MTDDLSVRPATADDGPAIRALHGVDDGGGEDGVPAPDLDDLDSYAVFLVGTLDGQVVATGGLATDGWIHDLLDGDDRTAVVRRMRVEAGLRGRGYGSRLLRVLETRAQDRGFERFVLDTPVGSTAAQRFYARHGFAAHRLLVATVQGDPHPVLVYRKRVGTGC